MCNSTTAPPRRGPYSVLRLNEEILSLTSSLTNTLMIQYVKHEIGT